MWLDVSGLCACFLGYYAMDSDCSLGGMPLAEWDRNGSVHALLAPLSHISWEFMPTALGRNPRWFCVSVGLVI